MNRSQGKDHRIETNKIHWLSLMKKYISKTIDMIDKPLVTRVNFFYKNTVILIII